MKKSISVFLVPFFVFVISVSGHCYESSDVVGVWQLVGPCATSTDIGTFVFNSDGTFTGMLTDEHLTTWSETGTYSIQSDEVTITFFDGESISFMMTSPTNGYGQNGDCQDSFFKVSDISGADCDICDPNGDGISNGRDIRTWINQCLPPRPQTP